MVDKLLKKWVTNAAAHLTHSLACSGDHSIDGIFPQQPISCDSRASCEICLASGHMCHQGKLMLCIPSYIRPLHHHGHFLYICRLQCGGQWLRIHPLQQTTLSSLTR